MTRAATNESAPRAVQGSRGEVPTPTKEQNVSILAENPNHVDVGTRVRHRPTGDVGTVAHLPRWGTASVVVRFDEPDEHGERIGAVRWPDLERVVEPPTRDVAAALAARAGSVAGGAR